ncbi:MAG: peptidase family M48-domain-containing protein [Benjaminiella poitrasii]|nr:MAG: peptidase family M48-domain-containing protein [Benjaminiella poitrasii]
MFRQIFKLKILQSRPLYHRVLTKNVCHHTLRPRFQILQRSFHTTQPVRSPIVPIPAVILGILKTGKLVSFISLSSKTSLTLLPHTFRKSGSRGVLVAKILAGIPLFGFMLLLIIGLDQAPNTSRLRLIYLTEEEEEEIVMKEMKETLEAQIGLVIPRDNEVVMWLQTIVDNLAFPAVDDVRDPIRQYRGNTETEERNKQIEASTIPAIAPSDVGMDTLVSPQQDGIDFRSTIPKRNFEVNVIWDSTTINAMCAGSSIIVYNLLLDYLDYDPNKIAVILSHEIAHSIQRHFVEQHGFASLMFMLGDISRGIFWMVTESMGPYVNQKINEYISNFIRLETQTTYNRQLEKEADLVGLRLMAKAGYDPRAAIDVWQRMAELDTEIDNDEKETKNFISKKLSKKRAALLEASEEGSEKSIENAEFEQGIQEFLDALINSWFGSTHPPSLERVEYMREHMDEAIELYDQAIKLNGPPTEFVFSEDAIKQQQMDMIEHEAFSFLGLLNQWLTVLYTWPGRNGIPADSNNSIVLKEA